MTSRLWIAVSIAGLMTLGPAPAHSETGNQPVDYMPSELVCSMQPGYNIDSLCSTFNATHLKSLWTGYGNNSCYLIQILPNLSEDSMAIAISGSPGVVDCTPNYIMQAPEPVQRSQPFLDVTGPAEVQNQDALVQLQLFGAHAKSTGAGIKVAVIDVGVDASHPMLAGAVLPGFDYIDGDMDASDEAGGSASGHGTLVAGIIHLVAPDARIVPFRVIDTLGNGSGFDVALAILDAIEAGCRIINISMVMEGTNPAMEYVVQTAREQGVLIIGAAGNDTANVVRYPAAYAECVGVAALDAKNVKCVFSNWGAHIDLSAPGHDIKGPFIDDQFARWSGTSFAAPFVSGTSALLLARRPLASWSEVVSVMTATARNIDSENPSLIGMLGSGRIDPLAAINEWAPTAGDVDASGQVTSFDILYLAEYVFKGGPAPEDLDDGDADGSCTISASDVIYLVQYVFRSGPLPLQGCVAQSDTPSPEPYDSEQ